MASSITVSPLTPAIGAEIGNIDLRQVSSDEIADIRATLLEYKVVFQDQTLTQAEHISFAREFGDLEIHPATPKSQSNPEVLHIAHGPESKGKENFWHSDVTWREKPSLGSILKAVEVPAVGGDTLFANMVMAYKLLPDDIKEAITGQVAVHDIARVFAGRLNKSAEELRERYPPMEHPIVRTHPETGESVLYVNTAFTSHIKDMEEGIALGCCESFIARQQIQKSNADSDGSQDLWRFGTTEPHSILRAPTTSLRLERWSA